MFLQTQARYYQYEQGDVQASSGNIMQIPAMSKSVPRKLKINVLRRVANSAFSAWTRSWWASCNTLLMTVAISFREGHSVLARRYPPWVSGSCVIIVQGLVWFSDLGEEAVEGRELEMSVLERKIERHLSDYTCKDTCQG